MPEEPCPHPASQEPTAVEAKDAASPMHPTDRLPWGQLVVFLIVFLIFASIVLGLVVLGQNLAVAVGVPASLSAVALTVLSQLGMLTRRNRD